MTSSSTPSPQAEVAGRARPNRFVEGIDQSTFLDRQECSFFVIVIARLVRLLMRTEIDTCSFGVEGCNDMAILKG